MEWSCSKTLDTEYEELNTEWSVLERFTGQRSVSLEDSGLTCGLTVHEGGLSSKVYA